MAKTFFDLSLDPYFRSTITEARLYMCLYKNFQQEIDDNYMRYFLDAEAMVEDDEVPDEHKPKKKKKKKATKAEAEEALLMGGYEPKITNVDLNPKEQKVEQLTEEHIPEENETNVLNMDMMMAAVEKTAAAKNI